MSWIALALGAYAFISSLLVMCCLVVASRADDEMDRMAIALLDKSKGDAASGRAILGPHSLLQSEATLPSQV